MAPLKIAIDENLHQRSQQTFYFALVPTLLQLAFLLDSCRIKHVLLILQLIEGDSFEIFTPWSIRLLRLERFFSNV